MGSLGRGSHFCPIPAFHITHQANFVAWGAHDNPLDLDDKAADMHVQPPTRPRARPSPDLFCSVEDSPAGILLTLRQQHQTGLQLLQNLLADQTPQMLHENWLTTNDFETTLHSAHHWPNAQELRNGNADLLSCDLNAILISKAEIEIDSGVRTALPMQSLN